MGLANAPPLPTQTTAHPNDPEAKEAWIRAEVGRAALKIGVEAHDQVLLGGVLQEALKVEAGVWGMEL